MKWINNIINWLNNKAPLLTLIFMIFVTFMGNKKFNNTDNMIVKSTATMVASQTPYFNPKNYINASLDNRESNQETINTVLALRGKSPDQGKDYLTSQGYSRSQVTSIYSH
ncbi:MAG: hypothetical protein GY821_00770 [Gammaproteobacteria bacterium]|nr:hypothetical protein [Gammaproteobacteria bacterium]